MQFDIHMIGFDEMLAAAPSRPGAYALRQHDGLRFHVEKVERRRLLRVRLELPEPRAETRSEDGGGIMKVGP